MIWGPGRENPKLPANNAGVSAGRVLQTQAASSAFHADIFKESDVCLALLYKINSLPDKSFPASSLRQATQALPGFSSRTKRQGIPAPAGGSPRPPDLLAAAWRGALLGSVVSRARGGAPGAGILIWAVPLTLCLDFFLCEMTASIYATTSYN